MSLLDLLTGSNNDTDQVASQAESGLGISKGQMMALAALAVPLIIKAFHNRSQDPAQADALHNAIQDPAQDGSGGFLSNIFGGNQPQVENQLSQSTGIGMDKIGPAIALLGPLVMNYLGNQSSQQGVSNGGGLSGMLGGLLGGGQQQQQADNGLAGILESAAGSFLGGGQQQQGAGGLLGGLMGMLGK